MAAASGSDTAYDLIGFCQKSFWGFGGILAKICVTETRLAFCGPFCV